MKMLRRPGRDSGRPRESISEARSDGGIDRYCRRGHF
jgi:hypothetical protein